jgi:hypothetical protein
VENKMGTRADFYVKNDDQVEWLGSVAWDGYEWAEKADCPLMMATSQEEFQVAVKELSAREDWTSPEHGWPWPWDDSSTTDFSYVFDGSTKAYEFGTAKDGNSLDWPDMSERKNVTMGPRSGLIVFE